MGVRPVCYVGIKGGDDDRLFRARENVISDDRTLRSFWFSADLHVRRLAVLDRILRNQEFKTSIAAIEPVMTGIRYLRSPNRPTDLSSDRPSDQTSDRGTETGSLDRRQFRTVRRTMYIDYVDIAFELEAEELFVMEAAALQDQVLNSVIAARETARGNRMPIIVESILRDVRESTPANIHPIPSSLMATSRMLIVMNVVVMNSD